MLYFFSGTDREKARKLMSAEVARVAKKSDIVRITDAHNAEDLHSALQGAGMFDIRRVLVLEGVLANDDMRTIVLQALPGFKKSDEQIFWYEEKPDAETRRRIEKHAEKITRHDAPKKERDNSVFALASALRRGDRKMLWVSFHKALAKGDAPEALHGILFWGAKQMFLSARKGSAEHARSAAFVSALAELPHEARRRGFPLEYALERYLLSINKT